jgi:hypothetical protein
VVVRKRSLLDETRISITIKNNKTITLFILLYCETFVNIVFLNNKMSLCQYQNFFGAPGTGVHSYRIGNVAIVDVLLTIVAAIILAKLFGNFWIALVVIVLLGILAHRVFCVSTTLDKLLFSC